jgi:hypothetical protein
MMNRIKYLILALGLIVGVGLAAVPMTVGAVNVLDDACTADPNSVLCKNKGDTLTNYIQPIVNTLLFVLGALAVVMIIFGGIRYTTSAGDAKAVEGAKNTILYSVIGLVVALLAYAIVNFVLDRF